MLEEVQKTSINIRFLRVPWLVKMKYSFSQYLQGYHFEKLQQSLYACHETIKTEEQ